MSSDMLRIVPLIAMLCLGSYAEALKQNPTADKQAPGSFEIHVGQVAARSFDPINGASDLDELKRSFDSINDASDMEEGKRSIKRQFDPIEHASDMGELKKRGFDPIDHVSDLDESKRAGKPAGIGSSGNTAAQLLALQRLLLTGHPGSSWPSKRVFDPISHASDLDYMLKRPFDSIQHASDMGEFKRSSSVPAAIARTGAVARQLQLQAGVKRGRFDPIEHASDFEEIAVKRRLAAKRPFDSIEHASDMMDGVKRKFDSIEHVSDLAAFGLNSRKKRTAF